MPIILVSPDTIARAKQAREMMVELAIDIAAGRKPHPGVLALNSFTCAASEAWYGQPQTLDGVWVAEKLRGFYAVSAIVGDDDVTVVYRHNSLPHQRVGDMDVTYIDPSGSEPTAVSLFNAGKSCTLDDFDDPKGPFHIEITWRPRR